MVEAFLTGSVLLICAKSSELISLVDVSSEQAGITSVPFAITSTKPHIWHVGGGAYMCVE